MTDHPLLHEVFAKFVVVSPDGCWIWGGARAGRSSEYGVIHLQGKNVRAHRVAYEMLRGPIPEGLQLDHLCRITLCVNPAHLEPVTCRTNLYRGTNQVAAKMRQTECFRGHSLALAKVRGGKRYCQECVKVYNKSRYQPGGDRYRPKESND
jgi:hypothetical protein